VRHSETKTLESERGGQASVPGLTIADDLLVLVPIKFLEATPEFMKRNVDGTFQMTTVPFLLRSYIEQQDPMRFPKFRINFGRRVWPYRTSDEEAPYVVECNECREDIQEN
jgi:hypothetical protein